MIVILKGSLIKYNPFLLLLFLGGGDAFKLYYVQRNKFIYIFN